MVWKKATYFVWIPLLVPLQPKNDLDSRKIVWLVVIKQIYVGLVCARSSNDISFAQIFIQTPPRLYEEIEFLLHYFVCYCFSDGYCWFSVIHVIVKALWLWDRLDKSQISAELKNIALIPKPNIYKGPLAFKNIKNKIHFISIF